MSESARKIRYLATPKGRAYLQRRRARNLANLLKWLDEMPPTQVRAIRRASAKRRHDAKKRQALDILGHKCIRCGFDDERALQVDHVVPVGKWHPDRRYGERFWGKIIAHPEQFQRLCANCNVIKNYEDRDPLRDKSVSDVTPKDFVLQ